MTVAAQDFQARVQVLVQAFAQVAALVFLIVYGVMHDGAAAETLIPGFLALAGINVLGSVTTGAVHAYTSAQQAKAAAAVGVAQATQAAPETPAPGSAQPSMGA